MHLKVPDWYSRKSGMVTSISRFILTYMKRKSVDSNYKFILSMLTPKFGVCNRITKFDQTHWSCTKSHLRICIKTNTAIFPIETAAFFIEKLIVLGSNRVCLQMAAETNMHMVNFKTMPLPIPSYILPGGIGLFCRPLYFSTSLKMNLIYIIVLHKRTRQFFILKCIH